MRARVIQKILVKYNVVPIKYCTRGNKFYKLCDTAASVFSLEQTLKSPRAIFGKNSPILEKYFDPCYASLSTFVNVIDYCKKDQIMIFKLQISPKLQNIVKRVY